MSKINFSLSIFFLITLLSAQTSDAAAFICDKVGFFRFFLNEKLTLVSNTCDDSDQQVMLRDTPTGLQLFGLNGLSTNPPIPLIVNSDTKATGTGIKQFRKPDHTGTFTLKDGDEINLHLQDAAGGSCDAIAMGGIRCLYNVVSTTCPGLGVGSRVCSACSSPCKDYGSKTITVFLQGTPTVKCDVELDLVNTNCGICKGKGFAPVAR